MKTAQSVIEYLLIFGALVLLAVVGARHMGKKANRSYETAESVASQSADELANAFGVATPPN